MPPSIKILEERLHTRSTDNAESIARRVAKAEKELKTAELFDVFILNEHLEVACSKAEEIVSDFFVLRFVIFIIFPLNSVRKKIPFFSGV